MKRRMNYLVLSKHTWKAKVTYYLCFVFLTAEVFLLRSQMINVFRFPAFEALLISCLVFAFSLFIKMVGEQWILKEHFQKQGTGNKMLRTLFVSIVVLIAVQSFLFGINNSRDLRHKSLYRKIDRYEDKLRSGDLAGSEKKKIQTTIAQSQKELEDSEQSFMTKFMLDMAISTLGLLAIIVTSIIGIFAKLHLKAAQMRKVLHKLEYKMDKIVSRHNGLVDAIPKMAQLPVDIAIKKGELLTLNKLEAILIQRNGWFNSHRSPKK